MLLLHHALDPLLESNPRGHCVLLPRKLSRCVCSYYTLGTASFYRFQYKPYIPPWASAHAISSVWNAIPLCHSYTLLRKFFHIFHGFAPAHFLHQVLSLPATFVEMSHMIFLEQPAPQLLSPFRLVTTTVSVQLRALYIHPT